MEVRVRRRQKTIGVVERWTSRVVRFRMKYAVIQVAAYWLEGSVKNGERDRATIERHRRIHGCTSALRRRNRGAVKEYLFLSAGLAQHEIARTAEVSEEVGDIGEPIVCIPATKGPPGGLCSPVHGDLLRHLDGLVRSRAARVHDGDGLCVGHAAEENDRHPRSEKRYGYVGQHVSHP